MIKTMYMDNLTKLSVSMCYSRLYYLRHRGEFSCFGKSLAGQAVIIEI